MHIGALAHELGHAFTLQHCYLNDLNFNGNLMGNSFRGWRGSAMPEQFPNEETRLDRPSALMLRINPFFCKPAERVPEGKPPVVTITAPPGAMPIEGGQFHLPFSASQPGGPGMLRYHWDFGDGREEDGQAVPHPYKKPGHYEVKLIVQDSAGRHSEGSPFIWVRPAKP